MALIRHKSGRPPGSKNFVNRPMEEKAEIVFNEVFKTLKKDISEASPADRLNAAAKLAGFILATKTK